MHTTLNQVREKNPSDYGWRHMLIKFGKNRSYNDHIEFSEIIEKNDLYNTLWLLRTVKGYDKEIRLFAIWCARQAQHLTPDPRSHAVLDVAEKFVLNNLKDSELAVVQLAASRAAAWDAAYEIVIIQPRDRTKENRQSCEFEEISKHASTSAAWAAADNNFGEAANQAAWSSAQAISTNSKIYTGVDLAEIAQKAELLRIFNKIKL